jgi:hypothetical protein
MEDIEKKLIDIQGEEMSYISFKHLIEEVTGVKFEEIYNHKDGENEQKSYME